MEFTLEEQAAIQSTLQKKPGPSFISKREAVSGQKLAYLETWKVISLTNEIFGFNGWSHSVTSEKIDFVDHYNSRYYVGVSSRVKVQLKDGTFHEDIGYGISEGMRSKALSLEKAKKDSVSDGLKRALKSFGNALGNCLNDKDYLNLIKKTPARKPKEIDPSELIEEFPTGLHSLRRQTLLASKKRHSPCIPAQSNANDLEIKIPTPPPSLISQEEEASHFENLRNKKSILGGIPKILPFLNVARNNCLTSIIDSGTLTPTEILTPRSKRRNSDCQSDPGISLDKLADSKAKKARSRSLSGSLSMKMPCKQEVEEENQRDSISDSSPINLFPETSCDSEGSLRSHSPNFFLGFGLEMHQDQMKEMQKKMEFEQLIKNKEKPSTSLPSQDAAGNKSSCQKMQTEMDTPKLTKKSSLDEMEEQEVESLFAEDDPKFFSHLMEIELEEARREESEVKDFALSLGLAPSKTHEKYESKHSTIVAPVTSLESTKPFNIARQPFTNFKPFARLVNFPEEEFSLMCNKAKNGNNSNHEKQRQQTRNATQNETDSSNALSLTQIFNNLSDQSQIPLPDDTEGSIVVKDTRQTRSRILSPGVKMPTKSSLKPLFRSNKKFKSNAPRSGFKRHALTGSCVKKRKIENVRDK